MHEREIREMLDSSDPEQRVIAIRAAAQLRLFALEGRIAEELGSASPRIAAAAAHALGELDDTRARGMIVTLLGQADPSMRDVLSAIFEPDSKR